MFLKKEAVSNSTREFYMGEIHIQRNSNTITNNKTLRKSGKEPCVCLVAVAPQIKTNIKRN
jgi:hypothetical protein